MKPDAEIIAAVLDGRPADFRVLVGRYERAVLGAALAVLGDFHAAEEAAQDAFVKAYENLPALRRPEAFGSWLLTIARREALTRARAGADPVALGAVEESAADPTEDALGPRRRELLAAVGRLPEHEREAVMLHYFDGHSVREIAEMGRLAVGTVTKQLSRARRRLRRMLEREER